MMRSIHRPRTWSHRLVLATFLALCLIGPQVADAQALDENDNVIPFNETLLLRGGAPRMVWVTIEGTTPTVNLPNGRPTRDAGFTMRYLQPAYILREATNKQGRSYLLLATRRFGNKVDRILGWVPERDTIERLSAKRDNVTRLAQKCLLVNRVEFAKQGNLNRENYAVVESYKSPFNKNESVGTFPLRTLLYIYAEQSDHVLVGLGETFDSAAPGDCLRGWVDKSRVVRWDHRVALEWDVSTSQYRQERGAVFVEQEDAEAWLDLKLDIAQIANDESRLAYQEELNSKKEAIPLTSSSMRYPVLSDHNLSAESDNYLYHVGWSAPLKMDPERRKRLENTRDRLRSIMVRFQTVNLLFVIDKTTGMGPNIDAVSQVIDRLVKRYQEPQPGIYRRNVNVACSMYADDKLDGATEPFSHSQTKDLSNPKSVGYLKEFLRSKQNVPGGGIRESVFLGLNEAMCDWKTRFKKPGRNVVILLGDYGDHEEWGGPRSKAALANFKPTRDFLGNVTNVELYAVSVVELAGDKVVNQAEADRFARQCDELCAAVNLQSAEALQRILPNARAEPIARKISNVSSPKAVSDSIWLELEALEERNRKSISELNNLIAQTNSSTAKGMEVQAIQDIARSGFDLNSLGNDQLVNIYRSGLVWKFSREQEFTKVPQVREMALLTEGDVRRIVTLLAQVNSIGKDNDQLTFNQLLDPLIDGLAAENRDDSNRFVNGNVDLKANDVRSLGDWFRQRKIPVGDSKLLEYSKGDGNFAVSSRLMLDLKLKHARLRKLLDQLDPNYHADLKTYTEIKIDQSAKAVVEIITPLKPDSKDYEWHVEQKKRWFEFPGDPLLLKHVWVDVERELP
ncbi:vWA domain-containing protein [Blastopirellula marina]|uniref:VWFA domain-containing protein n=1 Tax=Blastopirellula marina TaxID=124 RepID=A0A2S8GNQ1_9BACT|nr:vWA domain-containing protein [Blastopirellula marina]PQO46057.1 hypothetical protein C5Y93_10790 [Blastopirellula marina]